MQYYISMTRMSSLISRVGSRNALMVIVLLAGLLRLINLGSLPQSFHNDEVMNGYVGRFTLQNGVDLYGNKWPVLYFDNFGDYPNILPMYLSGLSTYLFGVNQFAVRFPIAIAGVLTVVVIYLIAKELFPKSNVPIISAFVLAVSPWHVVLSRATAEGVTASMVFLLALWILVKGIKNKRLLWLLISYVLFGLTYLLYPSFRVFVPLALLPVFLLAKDRKLKIVSLISVVVFGIVTIGVSQTEWGRGRYDQTSVFNFLNILDIRLTKLIYGDAGVPVQITRAFHNKYWISLREIVNQYTQYWSGGYLFTRGGLPGRYQLFDHGLFYLSYIGIFISFVYMHLFVKQPNGKGKSNSLLLYFAYLLVLSPLPASLTMEDAPNVHRSLLMGVLLSVVFGYMIDKVLRYKMTFNKLKIGLLAIVMVYEVGFFWHQYVVHSNSFQAQARNSGVNELVEYLKNNAENYDQVIVPSRSKLGLHFLFQSKDFDASYAGKFSENINIESVGNIKFENEYCPSLPNNDDNQLIVHWTECYDPSGKELIKTIKRADGHDAYRIYEKVSE